MEDSKQAIKLIDRQTSLADDRTQGAAVKLFVIWHNQLRKRIVASQYDVTTTLPFLVEAGFRKRRNALAAGQPRKLAHTATRIASK